MRCVLVLLVVAACEKSGPVEATAGGSSSAVVAPVIERGAATAGATIGTDAGVAKVAADAAVVAVTPDAAVRRPSRDMVAMTDESASDLADKLMALDSTMTRNLGDLSRRRPGADLGPMIDDVRTAGRSVAVGGGAGRSIRTGTGDAGAISSGPKGVDSSGSGSGATPTGRLAVSSNRSFDESSLTPEMVMAKVQSAYLAGVKRCYKALLRQDATASGTLKLTFTVNESGRVVSPKARGFVAMVDDCVTGIMSSWVFPTPKDKDGEATEANFEIVLRLIPD
jgi:hypothetical protein